MKIESANVKLENTYVGEFVSERRETPITPPSEPSVQKVEHSLEDISLEDDAKIHILKLLIQELTGKEIDWFDKNEMEQRDPSQPVEADTSQPDGPIEVIVERLNHEHQSNDLKLAGELKLESGREIRFEFKLAFEQTHTEYQRTIETINMKDPLVISFTNKPVSLSARDHGFDIDADGEQDKIAHLDKGFGYLALDRNNNGKIDNGNELFGALSGNGFNDLSQYDEDTNGFIDENDSIFQSLHVWVKNENEDQLISLSDANIGAIGLQHAQTPLNIRNDGELKGAVRQSGFYLNNNGQVGLLQQIDLVV